MIQNVDPDLAQALPSVNGNGIPSDPYADYVDYTAITVSRTYQFPDGKQWLRLEPLTESGRIAYLKASQSSMKVKQGSNEAEIPIGDIGSRTELLRRSITAWNVVTTQILNRQGDSRVVPIPFNTRDGSIERWINALPPHIVDDIESVVREMNPFLLNDLSVEDIDKQIEHLGRLREEKLKVTADEKNFQGQR